MADVAPAEVLAFIGRALPDAAVQAHISSVTAMVEAYTRGEGFNLQGPAKDLRQVIVSACARSVANPTHMVNQRAGTQSYTPGQFTGFTLPELKVLNRYRKLAA